MTLIESEQTRTGLEHQRIDSVERESNHYTPQNMKPAPHELEYASEQTTQGSSGSLVGTKHRHRIELHAKDLIVRAWSPTNKQGKERQHDEGKETRRTPATVQQ